jgi:hypothetical protein
MTTPKPPYTLHDETVTCPHCHTIIGHFDGDTLKIGGVQVESITAICVNCGGRIYWSKFGGHA